MINFQYPYILLFIPLVVIFYVIKKRIKRGSGVGFSEISILKQAMKKSHRGIIVDILRSSVLILIIISIAGPVKENDYKETKASGIDIFLAIDVSPSMNGLDFSTKLKEQTRLDAVKDVVKKFIDSRPNDRIGVVAFAGKPYLASPLTLDHQWIYKRIDLLETGMAGDGTAIGSAIANAANHLNSVKSKSKIIILVTDGENNTGAIEPIPAATAAKALGMKVYTIGAGYEGEVPYRNRNGSISYIDSKVDEQLLWTISDKTGGVYFRAKDLETLKTVYEEINKLETTERISNKNIVYDYYFVKILIIAAILLTLEVILSSTILRKTF